MFERPTKEDIDRALTTLMHNARHQLLEHRNATMSEATKAGALQNSRLIIVIAQAAEQAHIETIQQATSVLRDFAQRMDVAVTQVVEWARPHLENLNNSLLAEIPSCGFADEQKRIQAQYQAQFEQRVTGALRDVEIGFVAGAGFAGFATKDDWVRAATALAILKPFMTETAAKYRICERAYDELIRARAERFHHGERVFRNHNIPKEFWWAKGHEALEQDWIVGDFSTWIKHTIQMNAESEAKRPVIPTEGGHPIRSKAATDSDRRRPPC